MFDKLLLGKILSDFVRVKSNVSPRLFTYFPYSKGNFWPRTSVSSMQISHVLIKQYPGKIGCLNTNLESLTDDVGLPRIKMSQQSKQWSDLLIVLWRNRWGSFVWLFRSAKVGQKSFFEWIVLDVPVLGQFLSDFNRVKSNVSPRLSTWTYRREIFDRTTPLRN